MKLLQNGKSGFAAAFSVDNALLAVRTGETGGGTQIIK